MTTINEIFNSMFTCGIHESIIDAMQCSRALQTKLVSIETFNKIKQFLINCSFSDCYSLNTVSQTLQYCSWQFFIINGDTNEAVRWFKEVTIPALIVKMNQNHECSNAYEHSFLFREFYSGLDTFVSYENRQVFVSFLLDQCQRFQDSYSFRKFYKLFGLSIISCFLNNGFISEAVQYLSFGINQGIITFEVHNGIPLTNIIVGRKNCQYNKYDLNKIGTIFLANFFTDKNGYELPILERYGDSANTLIDRLLNFVFRTVPELLPVLNSDSSYYRRSCRNYAYSLKYSIHFIIEYFNSINNDTYLPNSKAIVKTTYSDVLNKRNQTRENYVRGFGQAMEVHTVMETNNTKHQLESFFCKIANVQDFNKCAEKVNNVLELNKLSKQPFNIFLTSYTDITYCKVFTGMVNYITDESVFDFWVQTWTLESLNAYTNTNGVIDISAVSCPKGIYERMLTGLKGVDPKVTDIVAFSEAVLMLKTVAAETCVKIANCFESKDIVVAEMFNQTKLDESLKNESFETLITEIILYNVFDKLYSNTTTRERQIVREYTSILAYM